MVRAVVLVALLAGCVQEGLEQAQPAPALDAEFFRCNVQPVLAARCSFAACHGSNQRPLRVFAVQRMRLEVPWTAMTTPLTADELAANYRSAIGFAADGDAALLLRKPLDVTAGGSYHEGRELYGGDDVFLAEEDPGYQLLRRWIDGETAAAGCEPTEEVGP
jgi:hypothetical protein